MPLFLFTVVLVVMRASEATKQSIVFGPVRPYVCLCACLQ